MKNRLAVIAFLILICLKINTLPAFSEDVWIEQSINPNLTTELDDYYLHYTYGMTSHQNKVASSAPTGLPNIYLEDKKTGKLIQHIYGFSSNILSSSSFMLGLKNPITNKYEVFSSLYTNSKIYTNGNTIKSTSNKNVTGYGSYRYDSYLTPKSNDRINHKFVITNTGNTALTFRAMKNVDTELDGNDAIPVLMYGYNQGLYMGTDQFSVIYDFDLPYGPSNFTNYYKTYRAPTADTLNHSVFYPYTPADITGSGAESLGYKPNEIIPGTANDTGIYMKWDEQTVDPGESLIFEYDVVLSTAASSEYSVYNQTSNTGVNYVDDILRYRHTIHLPLVTSNIKENNSYIEEKIPEGLQFSESSIYIKNQQNDIKREIMIATVYDEATRILKIPILTEDIDSFEIIIEYDLIPAIELAGKTIDNEVDYQIDIGTATYKWTKNLEVPIQMPTAENVVVCYVDELNNLLSLDDKTDNPLILSGIYGETYHTESKSIAGYELVGVDGDETGEFSKKSQIIRYVYKKQQYEVTFNTNGGSQIDSQYVPYKEIAIKPDDPIYDNRKFKGWYMDSDFTQEYDFSTEILENLELFAKWQTGIITPDGELVETENSSSYKDMLRIQYVSDFSFGIVNRTTEDVVVKSVADTFEEKEVAPFISIIDDRPEALQSNWRLTVTRDEFSTKDGQKQLSGSKLLLSNMDVIGTKDTDLRLMDNQILIGVQEENLICEVQNSMPFSSYSIVFGQLDSDSVTTGVSLEIPGIFSKETTKYTSRVNWNIVTGGP